MFAFRFKLILIPMSKRNRGGGEFWLFEDKEAELAEGDQNRLWDPVVANYCHSLVTE